MSVTSDNRNVILIILLIILAGSILPIVAVHVSGNPSHLATLRGEPVTDSIFAELAWSEPDPVVFPQFPVVETETSITMESDYDGLEAVNESMAISAGLDFISKVWYLADINLSINTGWSILDDGSWRFQFIGANLSTYVSVNAMSGKVDNFASLWSSGSSPFMPDTNESNYAASDQVEQLAFDFLRQFNYTLSPHALYVGPSIVYNYALHHNVYRISLLNYVNDIPIEHSGVWLDMDLEATAILEFSYWWVHVDRIPTESIISPIRAEQYAIDYLKGPENLSVFEIQSTILLFDRTWTQTGYIYRLAWLVSINSDYVKSVFLDAKTGIKYDIGVYGIASLEPFITSSTSRPPLGYIIWLFAGSVFIATVSSLILKKKTKLIFTT
jgi:hypothetical protein